MKINKYLKFKRDIKGLSPEKDWYLIVILFFVIFLTIMVYSIYSYFFIKRQIYIINNNTDTILTENATTTDDKLDENKLLKDINNINKVLINLSDKDEKYAEIIKNTPYLNNVATTTKQ